VKGGDATSSLSRLTWPTRTTVGWASGSFNTSSSRPTDVRMLLRVFPSMRNPEPELDHQGSKSEQVRSP